MTLAEIGERLKIARDGLGLSLSQIHERTKIPYNHLQALESGLSDDLPEPVYISGFIKRYAESVGLDGQELSEAYRDTLVDRPVSNGRFAFLQRGPKEQPSLVPAPSYNNRISLDEGQPNPLKTGLLGGFFIIVALSLAIFLFSHSRNNDQNDQSFSQLKESAAKISAIDTSSSQINSPAANQTDNSQETSADQKPASDNDAHIVITASQHVWVEVKAMSSGEALFTGFLESGDRRNYSDSQGLRIVAGNGKSLSVETSNGKSEIFGVKADKTERTFLAKNAAPNETASTKTASAESATTKSATTTPAKHPTPSAQENGTSKVTATKPSHHQTVAPTRQYIPGESIGNNTRTIDVPYRYSE